MKIGLVSRVGMYHLESWEEEFKVAASLEAKHLELIINYPYFGPSSYTSGEMFRIKDLSHRYNMELIFHLLPLYEHAPENVRNQFISIYGRKKFFDDEKRLQNRFFDIATLDDDVRKFSVRELTKTYNLAALAGAKIITIHGGYFESFRTYRDHLEHARDTLENLNGTFKQAKLCIENLPIMGPRCC
ncbi:hypothetical protein J4456_01735 [Candidatus Pacearchaeota archaeon]|nr:hypothetical protein [Candidatus Pacearchaeota archaeon]